MNTVEKKEIERLKVISVVAIALAATLAISSLWLLWRSDSLQIQVSGLQTNNDFYQTRVSDLTGEKNSLQNQVDSLTQNNTDLHSEVDTLTTENDDLKSQMDALTKDNTDLQSEIDDLMEEIDDLQSEKYDLEAEINNLQREIDWLKQIAEEDNFQFYYASLAKQRYGVDDLEEYLDRWEWTEGSYVAGVFDCSEMSAYIEWRLENEGYHTYIVCGETPWGDGYHAWLLVETSEGKYMPVEATQYDLVKWSSPDFDNYFTYDHIFETIQDALDYNYSEFDWWN